MTRTAAGMAAATGPLVSTPKAVAVQAKSIQRFDDAPVCANKNPANASVMYSVRLMSRVKSWPRAMNSSMLDSMAVARQAAAGLHGRGALSHTATRVQNAHSAV